ncbi:hypothetical protein CASFOL_038527 [Castilleja foliolosa]|uniref:Two-component response regulator n=1 Tax=Castilleja foliolosa TaxID=1961234 RepID=A0ABD3BMG7_9LAMI
MMWEMGNIWADNRTGTVPMAPYHTMVHEIHVLLVDHDSDGLFHTAKLLEICQYRVTLVELASAALSMLTSGKSKFDVIIANLNSPDLHGFKLLQLSVSMGLPTVVTSSDDNPYMAMRALESGAFLYVKKPITMDMLKCLWQHVVREKIKVIRERENLVAPNNHGPRVDHQETPSNLESMMNNEKSKKKNRGSGGDTEEYGYANNRANNNVKRKMCTEWTQELHEKFLDAVEELGEGRCFPKDILDLMNVPGLTRMQVASHLQKCRNANWRSPLERKTQQALPPVPVDPIGSANRPRKFGSKPQLGKAPSGKPQESNGPGQGSKAQSENEKTHTNGTLRNMGIGPKPMTNASHHHYYGPMGSGPNNALGRSSDHHGFYSYQNVDCIIQNFPGMPQGPAGQSHPNPGQGPYHLASSYHEQSSAGPSVDCKSKWSSDTSNFESDQSEC